MTKWDEYFINVAKLTSKLSYCTRLKVGAVAVKDKRIICNGYNGTPAGTDNCCEEWIEDGDIGSGWKTKLETSHAEENLISYSAKNGISLDGATLYLTHSPCIQCAKLIKNSGINKVIYSEEYRDDSGMQYLKKLNVEIEKYG
jgi:dCMP deaminase